MNEQDYVFTFWQDETAGKYICLITAFEENGTFLSSNFVEENIEHILRPPLKGVAIQ